MNDCVRLLSVVAKCYIFSHAVIGCGNDSIERSHHTTNYNWPKKKFVFCMKWLEKTRHCIKPTYTAINTLTEFITQISDSIIISIISAKVLTKRKNLKTNKQTNKKTFCDTNVCDNCKYAKNANILL